MRNKITILFVCIILSKTSMSQTGRDTLSLNNYPKKASIVKDSLVLWLHLSTIQADSAKAAYQDYFLSVIQTKNETISSRQKIHLYAQFQQAREARLRKNMTPAQYNMLTQKRSEQQEKMVEKMDALRAKHSG